MLVAHDSSWSLDFERESGAIAPLVGPGLIAIHHVGSTAISGIMAKPIIDMLAVVSDLDVLEAATPALAHLGYEAKGEFGLPGRRYFRKSSEDGVRTHHLHGYQVGSPEITRHLAFRDYLIAHPESARAYEALKL